MPFVVEPNEYAEAMDRLRAVTSDAAVLKRAELWRTESVRVAARWIAEGLDAELVAQAVDVYPPDLAAAVLAVMLAARRLSEAAARDFARLAAAAERFRQACYGLVPPPPESPTVRAESSRPWPASVARRPSGYDANRRRGRR